MGISGSNPDDQNQGYALSKVPAQLADIIRHVKVIKVNFRHLLAVENLVMTFYSITELSTFNFATLFASPLVHCICYNNVIQSTRVINYRLFGCYKAHTVITILENGCSFVWPQWKVPGKFPLERLFQSDFPHP